jgi:hypothetical protein
MTRQTAAIRTRRPSRLAAWATWLLCVTFVLLGLTGHASVQADERPPDLAAQVASAYVYKFASFIDWPDDAFAQPDSPFVIGVMGADGLADVMAANLAGRQSNGRKLIVKPVHPGDTLQGIHMLYLGNLPKPDLVAIYARLKGRPVLTITESAEAFALGSMINLVLAEDRLRFEIALTAVGASRLKVSALMLAAAYRVKRGGT